MMKTVARLVIIPLVVSLICSGCAHWLPIEPNFGKGELRHVAKVRVCADGGEVIEDATIKWPMLTGTRRGQPLTFDLRLTPAERQEINLTPGGPGSDDELPMHCEVGVTLGTSFLNRPADIGHLAPASPLASSEFASSPFRFESRVGHRRMRKAGWIMLGIGYSLAAVPGLLLAAIANRPLSIAGGTLLIPVAGPLVSSIALPSIKEWGIPWLLLDLPLQVVGVALIGQSYRTKQLAITIKKPDEPSVSFRPYLTPAGSGLLAVGSF